MEQLDTRGGGCFICEFVQNLPGEALTLEDGLLHGLTRSPSHMAAREDQVDIFIIMLKQDG